MKEGERVKELIRLEDPLFLSWLKARLTEDQVTFMVFDDHMNSLFPGGIGAFSFACRVMVSEDHLPKAQQALQDWHEMRDE